ncbi:hypothetical protein V8C35DRAFT_326634 [Trichoderma chlorosporum]
MSEGFNKVYTPAAADHTRTPNLGNLGAFNTAISQAVTDEGSDDGSDDGSGDDDSPPKNLARRYDMTKLCSAYEDTDFGDGTDIEQRDRTMTGLLTNIMTAANAALDMGGCALSDAQMAVHLAQQVSYERVYQAADAQAAWLDEEIPSEDDQKYLYFDNSLIDWDQSLDVVDEAVAEGEITAPQGNVLKEKYRVATAHFGNAATDATQSDRTHLAVLRDYQNSVREINNGVVSAGGAKVMPSRDRVPRCKPATSDPSSDPDSSSGSDSGSGSSSDSGSGSSSDVSNLHSPFSEKKKKRQMLPGLHGLVRLFKRVPGQRKPATRQHEVGPRQLTPISVSTPGVPQSTISTIPTSKSASSTSSSQSSSTQTTSSSSQSTSQQVKSTTSTQTSTGYDLAVTTTFTPPPECSSGLTEFEAATGIIWRNAINPVPSLTLTSCYPSQFVASALATTSLPQFSQLICPQGWESYNITSNYLICCPNGFGFYAPNFNNTQRPGLSAICTSTVWASVLMDITSYDATTLATVLPTSAGINGTLVFATAFDGVPATTTVTSSTSSSISSSSTSKSTTSSKPTGSTTSTSTSKPTSTSNSTSTAKPTSTSKPTSSSTKTSSTITSKPTSSTKSTLSTSTITSASGPSISQLPACGQTCFSNLLGQYSTLGCGTPDPACLCRNVNFGYGIRDCANGACGTAVASTVISFESTYCASATSARTTLPTTASATATGIDALPSCGQTCFDNLLAQYSTLGCGTPDPACLCRNVNFGYGIRDCSNGACGSAVASTVIAFESTYCASATSARTTYPTTATATATGIASLPSCGQTCFNNMLAQYSSLGCSSPDPACLCQNVNFGYGVRDCSNGACGTAVASTVIAFESSYCASATAAA